MLLKRLPCPNCGHENTVVWHTLNDKIVCLNCWYVGAMGKTEKEAVELWNYHERRKKNVGL